MNPTRLILLALLAAAPAPALAALSAATVWEVRTAGSDTNGGGFVAGASGTDWSQQNAPQYSVSDGVTAGTATITSATANFGADVVGNVMYVAGGTGAVAGAWYQITARADAQTITVDRATGLTAGTGVTLRIGGALASINAAAPVAVAGNKIFVKNDGVYTTTSTITFAQASITPHLLIKGYTTTRADAGRATLQLAGGSGYYGITISGTGTILQNIVVDANSLAGSGGISVTGGSNYVYNNKVLNYQAVGINAAAASALVYGNEVTAGGASATAGISSTAGGSPIYYNYVHDGSGSGIVTTSTSQIVRNIVANQSGATSDGIRCQQGTVWYNTIYNVGRNGISNGDGSTNWFVFTALGNVIVNSGNFGLVGPTNGGAAPATPFWDGNAFYNNAAGNRSSLDSTTAQNGVAPYTNVNDVVLSGDPFVNAAGGDFGLNGTAGAGAAVKGAGVPRNWPGASAAGYADMGAVQHQDPGPTVITPSFAY